MNILWQKANQQVQIDFNLSHQVNRMRILRLHEGRTGPRYTMDGDGDTTIHDWMVLISILSTLANWICVCQHQNMSQHKGQYDMH